MAFLFNNHNRNESYQHLLATRIVLILLVMFFYQVSASKPSSSSSSPSPLSLSTTALTTTSKSSNLIGSNIRNDDDHNDDDTDDDDDDDDNAIDIGGGKNRTVEIEDFFGDIVRYENANRTVILSKSSARFLDPITLKLLILGPLIGVTIKAALIRGLIWAVGAYVMHLFFPNLLTSLGLGTGLVGFARQNNPDYLHILGLTLKNLPTLARQSLPPHMQKLYGQYAASLVPIVESVRAIPDGPCRFRAVCELSSIIKQSTRYLSPTLQRLSATVYINFGTEYSKAWLDGAVSRLGVDCATLYSQCVESPLTNIASRLRDLVSTSMPPAAAFISQQMIGGAGGAV